ncbi:uncharacterized protein VTP21DRAFT_11657 [Calcarisporiella thermophila]|uniref:uncharacterized protein n=1 Tax=Calcarisporiella thermophila TaxID=911321 RepID=UPI003742A723
MPPCELSPTSPSFKDDEPISYTFQMPSLPAAGASAPTSLVELLAINTPEFTPSLAASSLLSPADLLSPEMTAADEWMAHPLFDDLAALNVNSLQNSSLLPNDTDQPQASSLSSTDTTPTGGGGGGGGARKPSRRDPNDPAVQEALRRKRQKNTDAARRSRLKKMLKMESLERRVTELETENSSLVLRVAVLESEKGNLEARDKEWAERVKKLEEQLVQAHKALTSKILAASANETSGS